MVYAPLGFELMLYSSIGYRAWEGYSAWFDLGAIAFRRTPRRGIVTHDWLASFLSPLSDAWNDIVL